MKRTLLRGGQIIDLSGGPAQQADVLVVDGIIAAVEPRCLALGAEVIDARGTWIIPGLWDAHVHFTQWVRSFAMVDLASAASPEQVCSTIRDALEDTPRSPALLFGFGYRRSSWPRLGTVAELDAATGQVPVALIAADAHNGWLNSAASALIGLEPAAGMLEESQWFEALAKLSALPQAAPTAEQEQAAVAQLSARGVVGIVDMEFEGAFRRWPQRVEAGLGGLQVRTAVYPPELDEVLEQGLRSGQRLAPGVEMGPLKIISDGSLGTRTAWCHQPYLGLNDQQPRWGQPNVGYGELVSLLATAHRHGLTAAVHAIGDRAASAALDAFAATGARGSIEHAQLLRRSDLQRFAQLEITASMQPYHLVDDRDLAEQLWADRTERMFLARSLRAAGANLVLGSDAPIAPLDPWLAMACATHRSGDERPGWHAAESLTPIEALQASVDGRSISPGQPADVVLLDQPFPAASGDTSHSAAALKQIRVVRTICQGHTVFHS